MQNAGLVGLYREVTPVHFTSPSLSKATLPTGAITNFCGRGK